MNNATRKLLKIDGFILALVGTVGLAFLWPTPGLSGGMLHLDGFTTYGVSLVFFLYGLTLEPARMRAGLALWKVHVSVQLATFVLFPVLMIGLHKALSPMLPDDVWLGFFFLAALPSTVSSSVAMTSLACGNVPVALFNASLSSLLGVFLTPLWMSWWQARTGMSVPLLPVIAKVALLVLLPIVLGQLTRSRLSGWADRNRTWIRLADRATILAIVYNAFCDSVAGGIWTDNDLTMVLEIALGALALFGLVYLVMNLVCSMLGFDIGDRIACQFCGSKKSLASGAPMAKIMFGATPALGLILAPIMLYHFLQLLIVSVLASRFAARPEASCGEGVAQGAARPQTSS